MFSFFPWLAGKLGLPVALVEENLHVVTAAFVAVLITILSLLAWRKLRRTEACVVPPERLSIAGVFEVIIESVLGLMQGVMGARADRYFPLIGTIFIYLLISNLLGVIPGFVPPTDNINTNLACALVVFLYYNVMGIREQGLRRYIKHMAGPILWLAPLMLTIELVSHLVRPVSLSVRLFGNITGDHLVLKIFSDLVPLFVPVIFMGLTIFVAFIQAFVFSLLSIVYIALATEHESH